MNFAHLDNLVLRRIIIDRYSNPKYKIKEEMDSKIYKSKYLKSQSCIDEITIYLQIKNEKVIDYKYFGTACSICIAASDIIGDLIINKSFIKINKIIQNYINMIQNKKDVNPDILYELVALHNTYKLPARQKCALLTVNGIINLISKK